MTKPPELDAETKARIEAEEAYRAEVRGKAEAKAAGKSTPETDEEFRQRIREGFQGKGEAYAWEATKGSTASQQKIINEEAARFAEERLAKLTPEERERVLRKNKATNIGCATIAALIIPLFIWWWVSRPTPAAAPASQPQTVATADNLHDVTGTFPACSTAGDYDKLVGFMVAQDETAAENQFNAAGCINIRAGERVYNEGLSSLGIVGIRRQGETRTYYTAIEALK